MTPPKSSPPTTTSRTSSDATTCSRGRRKSRPVYLETPHRIEALLLCHFLAMLVEALIEREIRTSMITEGLAGIPLYPELRNCPAPSAPRILEIFDDVQRHELINTNDVDEIVQIFEPQLTPLQQQVQLDRRPMNWGPYRCREARNVSLGRRPLTC